MSLVAAAVCLPVLWLLNWRGVLEKPPYFLIDIIAGSILSEVCGYLVLRMTLPEGAPQ
jgi:Na+/H+ antiporter NhaA